MAESPAKKQCIGAEEKNSAKSEKDVVNERMHAAWSLIKISTEPPTYLRSHIISSSTVLTSMAYTSMKDNTFETNEFGDRCMICLPHDNISRETWMLLASLLSDSFTLELAGAINNNTLDDMFHICFKYDIPISFVSETKLPAKREWKKLQAIILIMNLRKIKQRFPRTIDISEINGYFKVLGDLYADFIVQYRTQEEKISFLSSFEIVPPVHHAITTSLTTRAIQDSKI